jgi:hypothetical protein
MSESKEGDGEETHRKRSAAPAGSVPNRARTVPYPLDTDSFSFAEHPVLVLSNDAGQRVHVRIVEDQVQMAVALARAPFENASMIGLAGRNAPEPESQRELEWVRGPLMALDASRLRTIHRVRASTCIDLLLDRIPWADDVRSFYLTRDVAVRLLNGHDNLRSLQCTVVDTDAEDALAAVLRKNKSTLAATNVPTFISEPTVDALCECTALVTISMHIPHNDIPLQQRVFQTLSSRLVSVHLQTGRGDGYLASVIDRQMPNLRSLHLETYDASHAAHVVRHAPRLVAVKVYGPIDGVVFPDSVRVVYLDQNSDLSAAFLDDLFRRCPGVRFNTVRVSTRAALRLALDHHAQIGLICVRDNFEQLGEPEGVALAKELDAFNRQNPSAMLDVRSEFLRAKVEAEIISQFIPTIGVPEIVASLGTPASPWSCRSFSR